MTAPSSSTRKESWRLTHAQIQDIFLKHDITGNASLDIEELHTALITLGLPASRQHVHSLFEKMDLDHDDKVTFDEFLVFVRGREEELFRIYNQIRMDDVRGGYITERSVAGALKEYAIAKDDKASVLMARELLARIGAKVGATTRTGDQGDKPMKRTPGALAQQNRSSGPRSISNGSGGSNSSSSSRSSSSSSSSNCK